LRLDFEKPKSLYVRHQAERSGSPEEAATVYFQIMKENTIESSSGFETLEAVLPNPKAIAALQMNGIRNHDWNRILTNSPKIKKLKHTLRVFSTKEKKTILRAGGPIIRDENDKT